MDEPNIRKLQEQAQLEQITVLAFNSRRMLYFPYAKLFISATEAVHQKAKKRTASVFVFKVAACRLSSGSGTYDQGRP